jgi:hypothetical protein
MNCKIYARNHINTFSSDLLPGSGLIEAKWNFVRFVAQQAQKPLSEVMRHLFQHKTRLYVGNNQNLFARGMKHKFTRLSAMQSTNI